MKALAKRLSALESFTRQGWDKVHRIIQEVGQSRADAIAQAGIVVGPNDLLIVRKLSAPVFDDDGRMIPQSLMTVGREP